MSLKNATRMVSSVFMSLNEWEGELRRRARARLPLGAAAAAVAAAAARSAHPRVPSTCYKQQARSSSSRRSSR